MDALQLAKELWESYNKATSHDAANGMLREISALTAIAQAEQLKRLGDLFEQWMSVQGVLPEFFEAVERAKMAEEANESMEEHRDNIRRAKEQMDGLRRGMGLE